MKDKFNQFQEWVINQGVELSSKEFTYQCMDLAYSWVFYLNIPKATIQNLYAYEVYKKPKAITKEHFELIPNSPDFVPQAGDLIVFDKTPNNVAGHIAIANGNGTKTWFESLDQNWNGASRVQVIKHNYDNPKVLGVLRYKEPSKPVLEITDQTRVPQLENMEVQQIRSTLNDLRRDIENLKKEKPGKLVFKFGTYGLYLLD